MATRGKGKPAGPGISPAIFGAAVVILILIVAAVAYFSFHKGTGTPTAATDAQTKAMGQDPTLMGKAGEGK